MEGIHPIIPNHYFAYVSSECQLLFKDGYYYGCISLCQSVAEALARFMYEKWTGNPPVESFGANINKIKSNNVKPDVSNLLNDIYKDRRDFHHLNKTVPIEYAKLKEIAKEKIDLLNRVESEIFKFENTKTGMKFRYPKYWETTSENNVYLRLGY